MSAPGTTTAPNPLAKDPSSQGTLWVEVTIPVLVLTATLVGVRLWWRNKTARLNKSDYIIVVALVCAVVQEILGCIAILKWGLGHHAAYIGLHKTQKALMYFYLYQIFYKTLVSVTKMSFVFLYQDLFPVRKFVLLCHGINISIFLAMIAFVLATIMQCTPIPYFWNRTIKGGHCISVAGFWYGHAAWNTAMDIIILLLPIPVIRSLQMGRNQKVAVLGVFGLGAFVIVASVMRMIALDPASKTTQMDMTYVISTSNAFLWTQLEACVAVICTCLPTLKGPIKRYMPAIFGSSIDSKPGTYDLESRGNTRGPFSGTGYMKNTIQKDAYDSSSQERILGITKTVGVEVTTAEQTDDEKKSMSLKLPKNGPRL